MCINNLARLWAVVDIDSGCVVFADYHYNIAQSFRDRLWKSCKDTVAEYADQSGDSSILKRAEWLSRYQLVRYDINRAYIEVSPARAALSAFGSSLIGRDYSPPSRAFEVGCPFAPVRSTTVSSTTKTTTQMKG